MVASAVDLDDEIGTPTGSLNRMLENLHKRGVAWRKNAQSGGRLRPPGAGRLKDLFQLTAGLRTFFMHPITLEQGKANIKTALARREEQFLEVVRTHIYGHDSHPYLELLKHAGCDFEDIRNHVRQHGIENTLTRLAREGVYLTSDEYKGKKDVVRGQRLFRVSPGDFEPRWRSPGFAIQSSGTKNRPVRSFISLDWLEVRSWAMGVFFASHDLLSRSHALYDAILPGSGVNHLLINAKLGRPTERWFARSIPSNTPFARVYHHLTTYLIVLAGKQWGAGLPRPEFIGLEDLQLIVRWIEQKRRDRVPLQITTIVSSAVRLAQAARQASVSLEGVKFVVSGEPFTEAKRNVIESAGSRAVPHYAYGGGINAGFGCANPVDIDEVHVNRHMLAIVAHPKPIISNQVEIRPLLCSTIRPEAPRILLNVESGDYGLLTERECGCELGSLGLNLHLSQIRSYEKFTSEGMNYFYGDLFEFVEDTLPREFGGGPGDYQLVEEEDNEGLTRLIMIVHPRVGKIDDERLLSRLRERLRQGPKDLRFVARLWEDAGTLRVRRATPYSSGRGKILPLHLNPGTTQRRFPNSPE